MRATRRAGSLAAFETHWRREVETLCFGLSRSGISAQVVGALGAHLSASGKRLRPRLFLSGLEVFGGERRTGAYEVACALELFHTFLLIHDDLVDRADTRRGEPVLQRRLASLGVRPGRVADACALVLGDILFGRCLALLHRVRFPEVRRRLMLTHVDAVVAETGAGQVLEFELCSRPLSRTTVAQVRRVAVLKTSRYTFEAPLVLAALAVERSDVARELRPATDALGVGFQLLNDLYEVRRMEAGLAAVDFSSGVRTEAMVRLHRRLPKADAARLEDALAGRGDGIAPGELAGWLLTEHIGDRLEREARVCIERAHRRLAASALPVGERTALSELFRSLESSLVHSESLAAAGEGNRLGGVRGHGG